jgi:hypothetical protein
MVIDRYTKLVLTIIALCLVWLCVRDSSVVRTVRAGSKSFSDDVMRVRIVGIEEGYPWSPVNVRTKN